MEIESKASHREKLDIINIIEVQEIRKLLINHPDLLSMFEILIVMCNNRLEEQEQEQE
jgi:hypothetical protein